MVFLKGSSYLQNGEHCSGDSPKESFGFLQRCGLQGRGLIDSLAHAGTRGCAYVTHFISSAQVL